MLRTLRRRFVFSHILPLLIIVPLMGIALIYVLETQVLLPSLANELKGQAALIAQMTNDFPEIWSDPTKAQSFVDLNSQRVGVRVMLFTADQKLLASSNPGDTAYPIEPGEAASLREALSNHSSFATTFSPSLLTEVIDVFVPVLKPDRSVIGVVRLTQPLVSVYDRILRLRYFILGVLAASLIVGTMVGSVLALNLERPLRKITLAITNLASEPQLAALPEQGAGEVKLLTRAFNTLTHRLHSLEDSRSQLLANLVHELGRPLGAMHSAIQALLGGADQDATLRKELLWGIDEEVDRMRRLLDDLSGLHDHIVGGLELHRQTVVLTEWLVHVLAPRREAARMKGLEWAANVPSDLPLLRIDPDRMAQALSNLVDNAIKYTPPGGTVSIDAGVDKEIVWIRVSDTGPGISSDDQRFIFDPFYRAHAGQHFPQGMGLGLAIARDLIKAHGGTLKVESTLGAGSHFTLTIPLPSTA